MILLSHIVNGLTEQIFNRNNNNQWIQGIKKDKYAIGIRTDLIYGTINFSRLLQHSRRKK